MPSDARPGFRGFRRAAAIYLFVLPSLIPMIIIVGIPVVQTIFFSFTNLKEKNFDLWTIGISKAGEEAPKCAEGVAVKMEPDSPAAKVGVPDGACVVAINGEKVRNAGALGRLLDKAQREFQNKKSDSVELKYLDGVTSEPKTTRVQFVRQPFDWSIRPDRDNASWGLVGLRNYRNILIPSTESNQAKQFYRILGITVLWTGINVSLHYLIGLGLALLLNRGVAGTKFYRVLLMLPWAVPVYVSAFSWRWLFNNQYGFFNIVLQKLSCSPIPWLSDATWTFVAVSITNVWLGVPFMMITLLAGMQSIPRDLYESAAIDGCGRWRTLLSVTLPLLRPVSMTAILLGAIWTFNMFNVIWLVQGGGNTVEILATYAFRLFRDFQDYAGAAAYGTVILVLLLLFSLGYLRILQRGELRA
ncbi:MAG: ABC transporter permease subunit [Candidatus Sumerlaeaceae bacterium]|nr:ABC transporter permease subunit [Candidatus Sumerlaeaceae bacterium]